MRTNPFTTAWKLLILLATAGTMQAYPEFQKQIVENSGRTINCALCHEHSDGPEGTAPGQIGHLTPAEQGELGRARAAFNPGGNVKSPILNAFGNHIVNSLGKKQFLELKVTPAELANKLPQDSDLDKDGIPDAVELRTGTHPLIKSDGLPWLLFKANFAENFTQILLMLAATILGLWGLHHLLHGFAAATKPNDEDESED
ncbi:MAG: hypothetical protein WCS43_02000 [Verrucomicrobiota bacterium]